MSALDGILEDLKVTTFDILRDALTPLIEQEMRSEIFFEKMRQVYDEYKRSGVVADPSNWETWFDGGEVQFPANGQRSSTKENIEPKNVKKEKEPPSPPPQTRPRRNAFKEASQSIVQLGSMSLSAKLRRPKELEDNFQNVYVKKEKLTMTAEELPKGTSDTTDSPAGEAVQVKKEVQEMPAPSRPAPRKKKRKGTERKIKQEKMDEEEEEEEEKKRQKSAQVRDSDIIVQDAPIPIVNLDSSDDGERTMIKSKQQQKSKRIRTSSSEEENKQSAEKRSKSTHEDDCHQTDPEDARSTVGHANNATFISKPAESIMNATVVVDNPKCVNLNNLIPQSVHDLMTDDESEEEVKAKIVAKTKGAIPRPRKPIFSPFEQSPVKKKVEAFEKLQEDASAMPQRTTRTKTRALAKKQQEQEESTTKDATSSAVDHPPATSTNVKEKAKIFTPLGMKFLPPVSSTTLKTNRVVSSSSNSNDRSLLSAKTASALKASQAEYREREKKRREKEQEALKKREALIQSQIEEKKRKREEKQLKAQQQREALEKEKLKALDAQRLKDERHRQLLAEQEEKKLKHKEEQEKKRQMAKVRALEEKKREEEKRLEEQKRMEEMTAQLAKRDKDFAQMVQKQKEHKKVPIYMQTRAPLMPTPDCYDSDDDRRPETISFPSWCSESNMRSMLKCGSASGERLKNTFFSIQAQTPDLQDIFETIEPKKLKRTSSAVWDKPPRFTMLPVLENHDETEEFDEGFDYD